MAVVVAMIMVMAFVVVVAWLWSQFKLHYFYLFQPIHDLLNKSTTCGRAKLLWICVSFRFVVDLIEVIEFGL